MISKLILSSLFAVLMSSGFIYNSDNAVSDDLNLQNTEQVVKAVVHNGEILPHISLPVVEITGELNTEHMVKAIVLDGEIMPAIDLQEVVITPNSGLNSI